MLMMPTRSQTRPDSDPKTSGMARKSEPCSSPVTVSGRSLPATAQVRNASTTAMLKTTGTQMPVLRRLRAARKAYPARPSATIDSRIAVSFDGTVIGGIWNQSELLAKVNVVSAPEGARSPNTTRLMSPTTR